MTNSKIAYDLTENALTSATSIATAQAHSQALQLVNAVRRDAKSGKFSNTYTLPKGADGKAIALELKKAGFIVKLIDKHQFFKIHHKINISWINGWQFI